MSITAKQFEAILDAGIPYEYTTWKNEKAQAEYNNHNFWSEGEDADPVDLDDTHTAKFLIGETGGEGSAEYIWQVWQVTDTDGDVQYFRKTGYYMSYDGCTWDGDLEEVEPFEKTVTDWKNK